MNSRAVLGQRFVYIIRIDFFAKLCEYCFHLEVLSLRLDECYYRLLKALQCVSSVLAH